ncbi:MAG: hypothetical protein ABEJ69_00905 [Candidatus Nanohaloarchaea archaeon]
MTRKGDLVGILPMAGLLVMAGVLSFSSLPISQAFGQEVSDTTTDLQRVAQTKSFAGLYHYNYIPTAVEHSVNQKAYELAQDGGRVKWNIESLISSTSGYPTGLVYPCSYFKQTDEIECNLEKAAEEYFNDTYIHKNVVMGCERTGVNSYSISLRYENGLKASVWAKDFSKLNVTCRNSEEGDTRFVGDFSTMFNEITVYQNRFINLTKEANKTVGDVYSRWQNVDSYTGWKVACDSKDYTTAEQNAVTKAENDITSKFSSAVGTPSVPEFTYTKEIVSGPSHTFPYGTSTNKFNGTESTDYEDVGDCNRCEAECPAWMPSGKVNSSCGYCDDEYNASVTITPTASEADIFIKDEKAPVITENGWKFLEFKVNPYVHFYSKD